MTRTPKFDEPTKVVGIRVPESQIEHYKGVIKDAVNKEFEGGAESPELLKKLYDIMNEFMDRNNKELPPEAMETILEIEAILNE